MREKEKNIRYSLFACRLILKNFNNVIFDDVVKIEEK